MRNFIAIAALAISGTAFAQDTTTFRDYDDDLVTEAGSAITAGGGVTVSDQDAGDAEAGGMWQVRGIYGTRTILGGELAYVGTARDIQNSDNTAISNGGEIALRAGIPLSTGDEMAVAPFAYGGLGYAWNEIAREGDNVRDSGAYVPVGVGLGLADDGFYGDARLSWREPLTDDLPGENGEGQLMISANIGAEF